MGVKGNTRVPQKEPCAVPVKHLSGWIFWDPRATYALLERLELLLLRQKPVQERGGLTG